MNIGVSRKSGNNFCKALPSSSQTDFDESDLAEIHSIEFFNSVCVVHKRSPQYNVLGERFIAGENELVVSGHHGFLAVRSLTQSQTGNPWSEMVVAPEEDWERLSKALSERDAQIAEGRPDRRA